MFLFIAIRWGGVGSKKNDTLLCDDNHVLIRTSWLGRHGSVPSARRRVKVGNRVVFLDHAENSGCSQNPWTFCGLNSHMAKLLHIYIYNLSIGNLFFQIHSRSSVGHHSCPEDVHREPNKWKRSRLRRFVGVWLKVEAGLVCVLELTWSDGADDQLQCKKLSGKDV